MRARSHTSSVSPVRPTSISSSPSTRSPRLNVVVVALALWPGLPVNVLCAADTLKDVEFYERNVRPLLVKHCYECHSEENQSREGGLLLDRESGWLEGGDSGKAVIPGNVSESLLWSAVSDQNGDLQMPPDTRLREPELAALKKWIAIGAPGPRTDLGETEFSRLGDQDFLFDQAKDHWAFQPLEVREPPVVGDPVWQRSAIDRFVYRRLADNNLTPSRPAASRILLRRLYYDLTGLPPTAAQIAQFETAAAGRRPAAVEEVIDDLLASAAYGEHIAQLWLDVTRYADTDNSYRPDTKTPHYFPFAFTYRDYVITSFNDDKAYDQFVREQLAADLMGFRASDPEIAALGFLAVGPHAKRATTEILDDWIDLTTRGLMGLTAACARCHDHKFEPIPTADYYSLHGMFASVKRLSHASERLLPRLTHYAASEQQTAAYNKARAAIDEKLRAAGDKKTGGNNRSQAQKIRETELAELLAFHSGAPAHAMTVQETGKPVTPRILIRGDATNKGDTVPRRFLKILEPEQTPFSDENSGRLDFADRVVSPSNPLTARVYVNRVWHMLMGSYLVATPSDFGLQGAAPTHPALLDWLAGQFMEHDWSTKWLVRTITASRTYQQRSEHREDASAIDPKNRFLWRANRTRLSIEAIRDTVLSVAGTLDQTVGGRPGYLWSEDYSRRRAVYGFINRFNPDPTLRAFDFPVRMQTDEGREESIVAQQALFTMNSPFVIDQATAMMDRSEYRAAASPEEKVEVMFQMIYQRQPAIPETARLLRFVDQQRAYFAKLRNPPQSTDPWPLMIQALLMGNELQYID